MHDVWDITASLLKEVYHSVAVEPKLQPLSGELFQHRTVNTKDGAQLDVCTKGFWGNQQQGAPSKCKSSTESVCRRHEREKEAQSRTSFVFSATGVLCSGYDGPTSSCHVQATSVPLGWESCIVIPKTMSWIRCLLNFSLLRLSITCICESLVSRVRTAALSEGQLHLVAREGIATHENNLHLFIITSTSMLPFMYVFVLTVRICIHRLWSFICIPLLLDWQ